MALKYEFFDAKTTNAWLIRHQLSHLNELGFSINCESDSIKMNIQIN